jgi:hypothetical protein
VRALQQLGDLGGLFGQGGQVDDDGLGAVAAAADGFDEGDAVVVAVFGGEQVARDGVGGPYKQTGSISYPQQNT